MPPEQTPQNPAGTPPPQTPPAPSTTPSPLKQIRTFQGDIAAALSRQNESIYSIQAQERARAGGGGSVSSGEPSPLSLPLLIGSLLLLSLAGVGGWYTYNEFVRKTAVPTPSAPSNQFISVESSTDLDMTKLTRDTFFQTVAEKGSGVKANEVRHVVLRNGTSTLSTATDFFSTIQSSASGALVRALDPLFMLGVLGDSRFLIFKLKSYDNAFGGMLNWEQRMAADVGPLFNTALYAQQILPTSVFKDVVYRNKDARVLYSGDPGATSTVPVIVYSFLGSDTLIITDRLESLQTVIDRLTREKLTR